MLTDAASRNALYKIHVSLGKLVNVLDNAAANPGTAAGSTRAGSLAPSSRAGSVAPSRAGSVAPSDAGGYGGGSRRSVSRSMSVLTEDSAEGDRTITQAQMTGVSRQQREASVAIKEEEEEGGDSEEEGTVIHNRTSREDSLVSDLLSEDEEML